MVVERNDAALQHAPTRREATVGGWLVVADLRAHDTCSKTLSSAFALSVQILYLNCQPSLKLQQVRKEHSWPRVKYS